MNIKDIQNHNLDNLLAKLEVMPSIQDNPELCAVVQGYIGALWLLDSIPRDSGTIMRIVRTVNRCAYFSSGIESYIIPDDTPCEISRQDLAKLSVEFTMEFNDQADNDEVFSPLDLFSFFGHVTALNRMGVLHSDISNNAVAYIASYIGDRLEKAGPYDSLINLVDYIHPVLLKTNLKVEL